ncbi:unnamed protein product [Cunninghamella blakesleeana]
MSQVPIESSLTSNNVNVTLGQLPLILTVPHGGYYLPTNIANSQTIFNHIKSHYNVTPYMVTLLVGNVK